MPMTPLLIVTHLDFGQRLLAAAESMLGPQEACRALSLGAHMGREDLAEEISRARALWQQDPLVLVDVVGGTPWNAALAVGLGEQGEVLGGLSLPLLIEALVARQSLGPREAAEQAASRCQASFARASQMLKARGPAE